MTKQPRSRNLRFTCGDHRRNVRSACDETGEEASSSLLGRGRRLLAPDERGVTSRYKDYRLDGAERYRTRTLPTDEFIRGFLLHVAPHGVHRISHYGVLASGIPRDNLARARELLALPPPAPEPAEAEPDDHRSACPCCGGRVLILKTFERCAQPHAPPRPT
jgi:hypothetical protein